MEHKEHHKREIKFLITFLIIFLLIFIIAAVNLNRGIAVFGIGLPYFVEDGLIIVLSFLSITKVLWSILAH